MMNKERPIKILQVSTFDFAGGAEKVAWNLFCEYRNAGHMSWLAVGCKRGTDEDVKEIPVPRDRWFHFWDGAARKAEVQIGRVKGAGLFRKFAVEISEPGRSLDKMLGHEDFCYPGTREILRIAPSRPDLIHCHNLHGGYFDLRALPWLSHQLPIILTLHDAWLLSGHCAHSFDCDRWSLGCGECPDLTIYPAIERDATAHNWIQKQKIYQSSRFYVATPSQWLMDKVHRSMLTPAIVESRVIPNGVDLSIFSPTNKKTVREQIGLPQDADVLVLAAYGLRRDRWKDFTTMKAVVELMGKEQRTRPIIFIVLGEEGTSGAVGNVRVLFVERQTVPKAVAQYYQAADLYIHAARADTFPNNVIESLACGTPVIATAVGGIPEQIKGLSMESPVAISMAMNLKSYPHEQATGILVPQGDPEIISKMVNHLLGNRELLRRLGDNASADAGQRFGLNTQVDSYLTWYQQILNQRN